jgi:hypothetical protein
METPVKRRPRFTAVALAGALGATVTLGACSNSSKSGGGGGSTKNITSGESPSQAVQTAIGNLGQQSSLSLAFSLPVTASQAQQIFTGVSSSDAQQITTGSIFFTEASGHGEALDSSQAKTDAQNSYAFGLTLGGSNPLEFRYVDQNIYLRVQAEQLATDFGKSTSSVQKATSQLSALNTYVPGITALGAGNWVEITHAGIQSLEGVLKQAEQSTSSTTLNSGQLQNQFLQLRTKILAALQTDSTFTSLGSTGGRSEYSVTVQIANFLNTISPAISSAFSSIPGYGSKVSSGLQQAQSSLPSGQTATADLYVSNNKVSEIDFDVNQFTKKYSFPIPVRISVSSPGGPGAPSGATVLDLSKLPSLLQGLLGSSGSSTTPTT